MTVKSLTYLISHTVYTQCPISSVIFPTQMSSETQHRGTTIILCGQFPPPTHLLTCSCRIPCHLAALFTLLRLQHPSQGQLLFEQPIHPAPHAICLSPCTDVLHNCFSLKAQTGWPLCESTLYITQALTSLSGKPTYEDAFSFTYAMPCHFLWDCHPRLAQVLKLHANLPF